MEQCSSIHPFVEHILYTLYTLEVEAWERSWDRSIAHGPTRRLLCQSQRGGTPTGRDARRGPCFFRHCLPRPLRLVYLIAEEKGATRGTLDFWPRSRPWPVALCHRRRPIQPAGLGPLRVSSVPAHKIGKCLFLCVVPLPASSLSPTPMGRCRPFTPPLSLLVLFLATFSLTAPFR